MSSRQIRTYCPLDEDSSALLKSTMERLSLSARAYDHILKVSSTLADLQGQKIFQTIILQKLFSSEVWIEKDG